MSQLNLGKRPSARCLNPECKLTVSWRHGQKPPKACPRCGYDKSVEDLERIKAKLAIKLQNERKARAEAELAAAIKALPWWKRWAIGLGLVKYP